MLQAIGTSMRGRQPEFVLCQFEGFFYMTSGNYRLIFSLRIIIVWGSGLTLVKNISAMNFQVWPHY